MEESGWKLVHGDVFRPPQYPMILSSLLGSGIQLFCMILIVICEWARWARCGALSPEQRGSPSLKKGAYVSISGQDGAIHPRRRAGSSQPQALEMRSSSELSSTVDSPTATPSVKPRLSAMRLASFAVRH